MTIRLQCKEHGTKLTYIKGKQDSYYLSIPVYEQGFAALKIKYLAGKLPLQD